MKSAKAPTFAENSWLFMMQLDKMNEKLLPTPTNGESVFGEKDEVIDCVWVI